MLEEARKYWNLANQITAFAVVTILAFIYATQGQIGPLAGRLVKYNTDWLVATIGMPVFVLVFYGGPILALLCLELKYLESSKNLNPNRIAEMVGSSKLIFWGRCGALVIFAGLGVLSLFSIRDC